MDNAAALDDFRRRWDQTYVWLKIKNKGIETLVLVRQVEYDANKVGVLHLESADYGLMTINLGSSDHSLLFRNPPVGVFQHGQNALLFRRRPARQWRRGICSDNSWIVPVTRTFAGGRTALDLGTVESAFKHRVLTKSDALAALNEKRAKSVALDSNLSISLSMVKSPEYVVFFWDDVVGRCDEKGRLTMVYEKVMASKLAEVFDGNN